VDVRDSGHGVEADAGATDEDERDLGEFPRQEGDQIEIDPRVDQAEEADNGAPDPFEAVDREITTVLPTEMVEVDPMGKGEQGARPGALAGENRAGPDEPVDRIQEFIFHDRPIGLVDIRIVQELINAIIDPGSREGFDEVHRIRERRYDDWPGDAEAAGQV